eukprot:jgi/Bigna1/83531/fgenesh1_pg.110_\
MQRGYATVISPLQSPDYKAPQNKNAKTSNQKSSSILSASLSAMFAIKAKRGSVLDDHASKEKVKSTVIRTVEFVDLNGIQYCYKVKTSKKTMKLRVSKKGKKLGCVDTIIIKAAVEGNNSLTFLDGYNKVDLPYDGYGKEILGNLSVLCRQTGVNGLEIYHPAMITTKSGTSWTVSFTNGLYVRQSFSMKSGIVGLLKKGDIVKEIESRQIDNEVWVRHSGGWCLAIRKSPNGNTMDNYLLVPESLSSMASNNKENGQRSKNGNHPEPTKRRLMFQAKQEHESKNETRVHDVNKQNGKEKHTNEDLLFADEFISDDEEFGSNEMESRVYRAQSLPLAS